VQWGLAKWGDPTQIDKVQTISTVVLADCVDDQGKRVRRIFISFWIFGPISGQQKSTCNAFD